MGIRWRGVDKRSQCGIHRWSAAMDMSPALTTVGLAFAGLSKLEIFEFGIWTISSSAGTVIASIERYTGDKGPADEEETLIYALPDCATTKLVQMMRWPDGLVITPDNDTTNWALFNQSGGGLIKLGVTLGRSSSTTVEADVWMLYRAYRAGVD